MPDRPAESLVVAQSFPESGVHAGLNLTPASLRIRVFSLFYEGVLLFALVFVASYLFISLARDAQSGWARIVFQCYLLAVCGAYFMFCWVRSGQTLPMKTWRLRLLTAEGRPLPANAAFVRYLVAVPAMTTGVGVLWALFDRDRQFLQDRIAGTRIVRLPAGSENRTDAGI